VGEENEGVSVKPSQTVAHSQCRVPQLITFTHVTLSPSPKSSLAWCWSGEWRQLWFYESIKDNACF